VTRRAGLGLVYGKIAVVQFYLSEHDQLMIAVARRLVLDFGERGSLGVCNALILTAHIRIFVFAARQKTLDVEGQAARAGVPAGN